MFGRERHAACRCTELNFDLIDDNLSVFEAKDGKSK